MNRRKASNYARFQNLEIGDDRQEFNTPEEAKRHVAKQLENLPGLKGDRETRREIIEEVAKNYDFTPPDAARELQLRELRSRIWAEEDAKEGRRRAGKPAQTPWVGQKVSEPVQQLPTPPERPEISKLRKLWERFIG
jgi:hypothetical protein